MLNTKTFRGANVFMSRNLVPPEVFDALLDALRLNGAQVLLCCDPSRNGPNDYHIISSPDHEKFEDLRAKGCNLLGPQCVLSCAKEHRTLPKQGFTCCLAMDGVKVLASGFDIDEKVKIEKLVTAMGGQLHTKTSLDVSFVIVKNVLAAKYKWALNILKKPVVTCNWLYQCWNEHRVVPQESYRVLPFSGLMICVTRIPAGDKYKVAQRWGHIHIVMRKWFDQSVARRACLNEESYPVQGGSASSIKKSSSMAQHIIGNSISVPSAAPAESNLPGLPGAGVSDLDLEPTLSQNMSSMFSDPPVSVKEWDNEVPAVHPTNETNLDGCVANDSQSEDSDLYLSECRISLVGFEASELRKLVNMVRRGGGSRYLSFNDKLTHIVVGAPTEVEKKELRGLAALGVIDVVRPTWLEDCDRQKKEVPVIRQHLAYDLLLPKDSMSSIKGAVVGMNQGKVASAFSSIHSDQLLGSANFGNGKTSSLENSREEKPEIYMSRSISLEATVRQSQQNIFSIVNDEKKSGKKTQPNSSCQNQKPLTVFKGKIFCFSNSFPADRRAEIIEWVSQGGGKMVEDHTKKNVNFTIECHGTIPRCMGGSQTTYVSSHWVRSCLEDESLLDVGGHIIYSPLPCQIPLPGFENFRFCISQYEEKDRLLLRNLCFVLGAKFVEKLTRKVTHLLCKFTNGPKYEAACKWGICSITSEWIYECVRQNEVVALDRFRPKEVTSQDQEAGLCTVSQFPTQAARMISGENPSQLISQSRDLRSAPTQTGSIGIFSFGEDAQKSTKYSKKARLLKSDDQEAQLSFHLDDPVYTINSTRGNDSKDTAGSSHGVPDVAAAIEDLLEQTSKIHDQKSLGKSEYSMFASVESLTIEQLYPSDPILGEDHGGSHSVIGVPNHWLNRTGKRDDLSNPSREVNRGVYDNFTETQTESQVVLYEEDLSGRQMIIDRVRTRSSMA
ncbi:topbp1, putative [Ricinus communis]|uniref:Topbp1, putative n=1 Tax=Ricinus communis TaxID=3988 RepID=B9S2U2_RICCO|nr:topbp1, putative [Ricinus communis]